MDRCDAEVFQKGQPLLMATTGEVGGNKLFESWVQKVAKASGQRVDWHYSGGIAQVLVLGDWQKARDAAVDLESELPEDQQIMRWFDSGDSGLYRNGVTDVPDDTLAVFTDPSGEQHRVRRP
jgi:hypothetical protein